jgi:hypothetical protein
VKGIDRLAGLGADLVLHRKGTDDLPITGNV